MTGRRPGRRRILPAEQAWRGPARALAWAPVTAETASRDEFHDRIDQSVGLLFALVGENLGWASTALLEQDFERANRVVEGDEDFDARCAELIALIKQRLSERSFDPDELEELIAILQIIPELERSGDLATHIARRAIRGAGATIAPLSRGLIQSISEEAVAMWRLAGEAYVNRSRDAASKLEVADDELDELCASLVSEGIAEIEDPRIAVDLALIARFYERLGDHAVNLSRRIEALSAPRRLSLPHPNWSSREAEPRAVARRGIRRVTSVVGRLRLSPGDDRFFELFDRAAANVRDCSRELMKLTASFSDLDEHYDQIKEFERAGDALTVEQLRLLDVTFITPFDREDIHELVEEIDDVTDAMFSAASLIQLVQVNTELAEVPKQAELLGAMAEEMVALIACLRSRSGARYRLEQIEQLEHHGDAIYRQAIARLFSGEYEAVEILKWKDIVQAFEDAMNAIEDVSDVVESILVKDS